MLVGGRFGVPRVLAAAARDKPKRQQVVAKQNHPPSLVGEGEGKGVGMASQL